MNRRPTPWTRASDLALALLFLAAIAAPWAKSRIAPAPPSLEPRELRSPAPWPLPPEQLAEVREYPRALEQWFGDRFEFRPLLIRAHNALKLVAFRSSPHPSLQPGNDGFLLVTTNHAMPVLRGVDPLSPELAAAWVGAFEDRREWLARRGVAYLAVLVPANTHIYPEIVPEQLEPIVGPTRYEQLADALAERAPGLRWLDLRGPLLAARDADPGALLFRRLDSHWSSRGALAGYRAILGALRDTFPALEPRLLRDFELRDTGRADNDWGWRLYLEDVLTENWIAAIPRFPARARTPLGHAPSTELELSEISGPAGIALPSALVFHDSFGSLLRPLLREHFRRAEFHLRVDLDPEVVERFAPDLVISVLSEPNLVTSRPAFWPGDAPAALAAEFAGASERLLSIAMAGDPRLECVKGASALPIRRPSGPALALSNPRGTGYLMLPEFALPAGRVALFRIDCEVPHPCRLDLEFGTADDREYSRYAYSRFVSRPLPAGSSTLYVKLHVPDLRGRIRLRASGAALAIFRAIEVAAVPRDASGR